MLTPVLETARLKLRPFCAADGPAVFACWENDAEVARYMFWSSHNDVTKSMAWAAEEARKAVDDTWYRFAIEEKATGRLIGTGLVYYEPEVSGWEVAYNLGRAYWGKGHMTEAMARILAFAREELRLTAFVGRCAAENPASARVLEKLGFQYMADIPYPCGAGKVMRQGRLYRRVE